MHAAAMAALHNQRIRNEFKYNINMSIILHKGILVSTRRKGRKGTLIHLLDSVSLRRRCRSLCEFGSLLSGPGSNLYVVVDTARLDGQPPPVSRYRQFLRPLLRISPPHITCAQLSSMYLTYVRSTEYSVIHMEM